MEADENQKATSKRNPFSLNPNATIFDENQERMEQGRREERWSTSSNTHAMARDGASKEATHTTEHKCPNNL
jgi:hypothetical protein